MVTHCYRTIIAKKSFAVNVILPKNDKPNKFFSFISRRIQNLWLRSRSSTGNFGVMKVGNFESYRKTSLWIP